MAKQTNSPTHTKWMCKYHIIFTPKYRGKIVYNQYKTDLRDILKQLCSYKGVEILEGHYWYLHCTEYPTESACIIFHKHRFGHPYHQHGRANTLRQAVKSIQSHDKWQMRRTIRY